jgi:hypothetical protein
VKRGPRGAWPKDIVEVPAGRPDPRSADPQATQKISRAQLEQALKRTKSGTRRALGSQPDVEHDDAFSGPRDDADDAPLVTIVRIDSIELEPVDPLSLPPIASSPIVSAVRAVRTPSAMSPVLELAELAPESIRARRRTPRMAGWTRRIHVTPRLAFAAGIAVSVLVLLAAFFGFFAGRVLPGSK